MLKKLLKYDLKDIFKGLIVFYILSLFFAIPTRIFLKIENSFILNIIGKVCSGVTISMIFNILINNLMRLLVRFKQNLYGDEAYLTHTLPITKNALYLSKTITSVITLFTSVLVIVLSLFVAYYSKENIEVIKNLLLPVANTYNSTILKILLSFLFIFFLEFMCALQAGYTGIILGHKMNGAKTGFSILFGFISYMIMQIVVLIIIFVAALFNSELMTLFFTNQAIDISLIKIIIYLSISIYTFISIINYFINLNLFKKGVNVD